MTGGFANLEHVEQLVLPLLEPSGSKPEKENRFLDSSGVGPVALADDEDVDDVVLKPETLKTSNPVNTNVLNGLM